MNCLESKHTIDKQPIQHIKLHNAGSIIHLVNLDSPRNKGCPLVAGTNSRSLPVREQPVYYLKLTQKLLSLSRGWKYTTLLHPISHFRPCQFRDNHRIESISGDI